MCSYIIHHTLITNFGGLYMIWEARLAYTLGGISSQFPSIFLAFFHQPKIWLKRSKVWWKLSIKNICMFYSPYYLLSNSGPFGESWNPLESWLVKLEFFPIVIFSKIPKMDITTGLDIEIFSKSSGMEFGVLNIYSPYLERDPF